jgi:hypothetical protein
MFLQLELLEILGIVRRTILKWIFDKWFGKGVHWILLAQDRKRWYAVVNTVMDLGVS